MKKMKVLYIAHDSSLYGANKSLINLVNSIKHQVEILVVFPQNGPACEELESMGINYIVANPRYSSNCFPIRCLKDFCLLPMRFLKFVFCFFLGFYSLGKLIKQNKFDLIHTNSSVLSNGFFISKLMNKKHVWHLREFINLDHGLYPFFGFSLLKRMISRSDGVISITKSVAKHFSALNSLIIPDAVSSFDKILPSFEPKRNFLFCGALTKGKGLDQAIIAFSSVSKCYPNLELNIAGSFSDSSYELFIIELIGKLKLEKQIKFLGFISNPIALMNTSLALLMCSKNEGMGRVTTEAMLNDCLVIGYNNAGTKELIRHEETGFLYNSLEQLIDFMFFSIKEPEKCCIIRSKAKEFALNNFTEEVYSRRIIKYYNKILLNKN